MCPPLEETRRAVASRLGSVELDGTWRATYLLVHRAQGDFIALQLFDPAGALRLERQLPAQSGNCASLPSVIALVLERFFVRPEQAAEADSAAAAPPEEAPPPPAADTSVAVVEVAAPVAVNSPEPMPASSPRADQPATTEPTKGSFAVGAELWATNNWTAPGFRLERDFSVLSVGLRAGFDLSTHRTAAFEGSVWVRRLPISLQVTRELLQRGPVALRAGVELLGVAERASASSLAASSGGFRVLPGAGLRLGARLFPHSRVKPFFELSGSWLIAEWAPAFRVGETEVLRPSSLTWGGAFGVDATFF